MYKSLIFVGAMFCSTLIACGVDGAAEAEKYCSCMKDADKDAAKIKACQEKSSAAAEKMKDNEEEALKFTAGVLKCSMGQ